MAGVCVVIPAFNVERTLGSLVVQLQVMPVAVVVVDDGSTDRTAAVAKAAGAVVLSHDVNQGKGRSLRDGLQWGLAHGHEALVMMDGDGQHLAEDVPRLLAALTPDDVGIVVGNRMGDLRAMPRIRRWTNRLMSSWISHLCGQPVPDSQCGFRVVRRAVLERVTLTADRYEIESEILIKAARAGFTIASAPITTVYQHEQSRIRPVADTIRFFRLLRSLKRRRDARTSAGRWL